MSDLLAANANPGGSDTEITAVTRELNRLQEKTTEVRTVLARLLQGATDIERGSSDSASTALVEANEQLILSLMRNQTEKDAWAMLEGARAAVPSVPLTEYKRVFAESERRQAQLQEANEHLVFAALSAQDLQAAGERAHRRQTESLAIISHELRNPLAPISMAVALMDRVRAEELPRVQAIIGRQVAHMTRLVGDLLDVSRVNTGKMRIEYQTVDMSSILHCATEVCKPAMDGRFQDFSVAIPAAPIEMQGDPVRLAQVFNNLLDNASKYTQNSGAISLVAEIADDVLVVTIIDNGIGITAEALPHVFDPFVQDPHAIGFNGSGLGIGLTLVRQLVESHGGTVMASSGGLAAGSRFVVNLPLMGGSPVRQ